MVMNWYSLSAEEVLKQTGSTPNGLDDAAVQQKLAEHGKNELKGKKKISPLVIFIRQFLDVMILVLVVAAVISVFIGEHIRYYCYRHHRYPECHHWFYTGISRRKSHGSVAKNGSSVFPGFKKWKYS